MAIFQKYSNTFSTIENGTVVGCEYINTVRTMISALELRFVDLAYDQFVTMQSSMVYQGEESFEIERPCSSKIY